MIVNSEKVKKLTPPITKTIFKFERNKFNILKNAFITSLSVATKIISSFVISKVAAIYIGPAGLAFVGQFQNFTNILRAFSNGATNNGIIKYIAEYKQNKPKTKEFLSSSFTLSLIFALLTSIIVIFFRTKLSLYLLKTEEYSLIFLLAGVSVIFYSLNNFILSVLNGFKEVNKYVFLNITANVMSLILASALIFIYGLYGAMLSFIGTQLIFFFISIFFIKKSSWFNFNTLLAGINKKETKKLIKYSAMAITTALVLPFSEIFIRTHISETLSINSAGYWQGIWKISDVFFAFITTSFGIYYLPRLSELKSKFEIKNEILSAFKIIFPIAVMLAISIFIFRDLVIKILFTEEFKPMSELFKYQLIGDISRISAWVLGYLMTAKAMTKLYIFSEIFSKVLLTLLSIYFINVFGLIGSTMAFALNYLLYLIAIVYIFRKTIFE